MPIPIHRGGDWRLSADIPNLRPLTRPRFLLAHPRPARRHRARAADHKKRDQLSSATTEQQNSPC